MMGSTTVDVVKMNEGTALDRLPAGVYTVCYHDLRGFYLKITKDSLAIPAKVYGNVQRRVDKCIRTYKERNTSTGILMTGDKGTGKSLFMSMLANTVIEELNMPVILVRDGFTGSEFTSFIEDIGECAMVFDEFGKMYPGGHRGDPDSDKQKDLLSLMDGVDKTKRLFIMTENSEFDVNDFMLNRPSRIYYHFKYRKLDEDSIIDFCADKGVSPQTTDEILGVSRRSRIFSFDMLQTIVEEHTRFGINVEETIEDLNIDLKNNEEEMMEIIKVIQKDTQEEVELFGTETVYPKPNRTSYIRIRSNDEPGNMIIQQAKSSNVSKEIVEFLERENYEYEEVYINDSQLAYQHYDQLIYDNDEYVVYAKELPPKRFNYDAWAF